MQNGAISPSALETGVGDQVAFLKSILEGSTEYSIVAKDLDGKVLAWNEGARLIYGYQPEDIIGKSAFLLHHPDDVKTGRAQAILDEVRGSASGPASCAGSARTAPNSAPWFPSLFATIRKGTRSASR